MALGLPREPKQRESSGTWIMNKVEHVANEIVRGLKVQSGIG
jgi:hypothetical protein